MKKDENAALPCTGKEPGYRARLLSIGRYFSAHWQLYLLLMIPVIFVIIFKYAAYPGLKISLLDYKPAKGYDGSKYVGLQQFQKILKDKDFFLAFGNSMVFNLLDLFLGFPAPIILALMLNELCFRRFKRVSQTILYLPHFLSWVIIASVALNLFKPESGLVNIFLRNAGIIDRGIPFLTEKWHWAATYLIIGIWQNMGWGTIIYLAAITGIDPALYEAATIDGAGRFGRIWHVTLPGIRATMVTLFIMNLGRIMGSNYERLSAFGNVNVHDFQYQFAIYIYEKGLAGGNYSRATAVGLFQSVSGLILVLVADRTAKLLGDDGLL